MIEFLHRGELLRLDDTQAHMTLLHYLREQRGLTGTKEGCASGDCGACTVVVASLREEVGGCEETDAVPEGEARLRYEPLNACIAPMGSVHGRQLITVEDLAQGDRLHPVQQAMVDCHGSQCGFCTPGFVMSLFALYKHLGATPRETILEALGGNLCRCTGYRPILAAAEQSLAARGPDEFSERAAETADILQALRRKHTEVGESKARDAETYCLPASAAEAASLRARHADARVVAGGTDLFLEVTQQLASFSRVVDLRAAKDLRVLRVTQSAVEIGAAVTHRDCLPAVLDDYPELTELIERFGSLQIRSHGTVAGNIATASPIGDWPPVLLALGGSLILQSPTGQRSVSVDDFFLDYRKTAMAGDEIISCVRLPRRPAMLFLRAYKISKRFDDDISSLCMVIALHMDGDRIDSARVACGGMAAVPKRASSCEAALRDIDLRNDSVDAAVNALHGDFQPISDARASAGYRTQVAGNLLRRLQAEYQGSQATRAHAVHGAASEA